VRLLAPARAAQCGEQTLGGGRHFGQSVEQQRREGQGLRRLVCPTLCLRLIRLPYAALRLCLRRARLLCVCLCLCLCLCLWLWL
jgi:hypothetical protein